VLELAVKVLADFKLYAALLLAVAICTDTAGRHEMVKGTHLLSTVLDMSVVLRLKQTCSWCVTTHLESFSDVRVSSSRVFACC